MGFFTAVISMPTYPQTDNVIILEEVTVAAQKRSQSVQDVPIAIAVFNDEVVEAPG